ncbi:MAG: sce7726 family protein, partial [Burkholderiales bacterium]|nr:sce7726 family protein [Burkholderiales bacterium]
DYIGAIRRYLREAETYGPRSFRTEDLIISNSNFQIFFENIDRFLTECGRPPVHLGYKKFFNSSSLQLKEISRENMKSFLPQYQLALMEFQEVVQNFFKTGMTNDWRLLDSVFSPSCVMSNGYRMSWTSMLEVASIALLRNPESLSYKEVFSQLWQILLHHRRNEYVFKELLLEYLVKDRLEQVSCASEIPVKHSVLDMALFENGKGTAFEIKTDLDSPERLKKQIPDYVTAFSEIYVVTSPRMEQKIGTLLQNVWPKAGLMVINDDDGITVVKQAEADDSNLEKEGIFSTLKQTEWRDILLDVYGYVPEIQSEYVNPGYEETSKKVFELLKDQDVKKFRDAVMQILQKRGFKGNQAFPVVQEGLKNCAYFLGLRGFKLLGLLAFLEQSFETHPDRW